MQHTPIQSKTWYSSQSCKLLILVVDFLFLVDQDFYLSWIIMTYSFLSQSLFNFPSLFGFFLDVFDFITNV